MHNLYRIFLTLFLASATALGNAQTSERAALSIAARQQRGNPLACVAFSPNGKQVAVGGYQTVTLLDAATGRVTARLAGHAGMVTAVAFRPDGKLLAAAGGQPGVQGEIKLWDVPTSKAARTLLGHSDVIYAVAFSPDGKRLAASSYDHLVSLWSIGQGAANKTQTAPRMLKDHTDAVYAVAFSPNGKLVASAAGDRTVKVWDAATGKRLYTLSDSTAELYTVAFRPDGAQIAAGGVDKTLRAWNVAPTGGALAHSAFAHEAAILRVVYARDGKTLFTAGEDNAVKGWDANTLAERKVYARQPDWPQGLALSPNDRLLAVSRYDGSLALYDTATGQLLREPLKASRLAPSLPQSSNISRFRKLRCAAPDADTPKPRKNGEPTLVPASLDGTMPTGAKRGQTVRFTLNGKFINDANALFFDDPAITGSLVTPPDKETGILRVDVVLGAEARLGLHRVWLQTPRGATGSVNFVVGDWPEIAPIEPNDTPTEAQKLALPCTALGVMDKAGDTDSFRFDAQAGEELVFEVIAQPIRSRLQPVLTLLDASGKTLAERASRPGAPDVVLGYKFSEAGSYVLQLRDAANATGSDVPYRLNAGAFPLVTRVFPPGLQKGAAAEIQVEGFNLGGKTLRVQAPSETSWGKTIPLPGSQAFPEPLGGIRLAVGEDLEVSQQSGNDSLERAQRVSTPITINGRLVSSQKKRRDFSHYYRFSAKKGQTLLLDVMARRLGSPLDPQISVLDAQGQPIERAVLRAVSQTELVLNDRDSASGGFRLGSWTDFRMNDFLMAGREVIQIVYIPRGPDEDVGFRTLRGQRVGFLGTTPEFHSLGSSVYKVEIHPPGSRFSPNGFPLTSIPYQNDDGGALYGKDSYLEFTAPADGDYLVRLNDARGQQGEEYVYRLQIHPPRPDFRLAMAPAHPNLPKAGGAIVEVSCERYDGFSGEIAVALEGLPPGFTATQSVIEAGETATTLLITAAPNAVTPSLPYSHPLRIVAKAQIEGKEVVRTIEPDNGARLLTALPPADVTVATDIQEVVIHPGEEVVVEARIARQGEFGKRVPLDVRNLPYGVRVLDIGLNGVLITEEETARKFVIKCEPWVKPQTRPFYTLATIEGAMPNAALPLLLRVEPRRAARR